jgi:hypothetical protein
MIHHVIIRKKHRRCRSKGRTADGFPHPRPQRRRLFLSKPLPGHALPCLWTETLLRQAPPSATPSHVSSITPRATRRGDDHVARGRRGGLRIRKASTSRWPSRGNVTAPCRAFPHCSADQEITSICADFLVELRGFEPMAITGAGRSRAPESDGGQARTAKGLQLTRANGDYGVDGVNSVGDSEPERTAWLVLVPWRLVWLRDSATATTTDLAGVSLRSLAWLALARHSLAPKRSRCNLDRRWR